MMNKFLIFLLFFNTFLINSMEPFGSNKLPKKDLRNHFLSLYSASCSELPEVSSSLSNLHSKEEKIEIQRTFSSSFETLPGINNLAKDLEQVKKQNSAKLSRKNNKNSGVKVHPELDITQKLFKAINDLDSKEVENALHNGANINAKDHHGNTPLHAIVELLAKKKGHIPFKKDMDRIVKLAIFRLLVIAKDCDYNIKNKKGLTAKELAKKYKFKQIASNIDLCECFEQKKEETVKMIITINELKKLKNMQLSKAFLHEIIILDRFLNSYY